jgi:hypothetical protein
MELGRTVQLDERHPECHYLSRNLESLVYGIPGLWNLWSMESLVYGIPGLWNLWSMESLVYGIPGLWNLWSMESLVYGISGLWNPWSMESLVYGIELSNGKEKRNSAIDCGSHALRRYLVCGP